MLQTGTATNLVSLAEAILEETKTLTKCITESGLKVPSFSPDAADSLETSDFISIQESLQAKLEDLQLLVDGPIRFFRKFFMSGYVLASFQVALDFDFFSTIPSKGEISYEDLAVKAGLDQDRVTRIVRFLITHQFFQESSPEFVSHNAFSLAMLDEELRSVVHYAFDEMLKAAVESGEALKEAPYSSSGVECPFFKRHGVPIFEFYDKNPQKAQRFAKAMAAYRRMENSMVELRDEFHWDKIRGKVVDIGGGSGHVSMHLAQQFTHLNFIVQDDSTNMLADGPRLLTEKIRDRIRFQRHSFFEPQPQRDAAVFLIRQCTHNWADEAVVAIFKAVVPGLEGSPPETPLLINDIVIPEPGILPRFRERAIREADMVMLIGFGAKQRTESEFRALLKQADSRYIIRKVHATGSLGLLEVYLKR